MEMVAERTGHRAITVLVVEDDEGMARFIQSTLLREGYLAPEVVLRASEFEQALARVRPDLVLLDIDLVDGSGVELAGRVPREVPFVFVSAHADSATLRQARERRPSGFVVKPFTTQQLAAAVEMALGSRSEPTRIPDIPELALLSAREREVLSHLLNHKRVPAIAGALFISPHTVRNHLKSVFHKLDVSSQQGLLDRIAAAASRED
jgi:DNA-binding NarL/FixJ family response regulator